MDSFFRKRQPQQQRAQTLVAAVVTALEQLIERSQAEDLSELSMRAIAHRAGVGLGSIYEYFSGQNALFDEFLAELTERNFTHLADFMRSTHALPLADAVGLLLDRAVDVYLRAPGRTRVAIAIIFRLGRAELVVKERDRFAVLCAERVMMEHPDLDRARVEAAMRMALDAGMGIVMAELWRPTPDVRAALRTLTEAIFVQALGFPLWNLQRPHS